MEVETSNYRLPLSFPVRNVGSIICNRLTDTAVFRIADAFMWF